MPSMTAELIGKEAERAELQRVLQSQLFARSPGLARLLSYLCEKFFAGESGQIKEYSIAVDVFGRNGTYDQDTDSIVRVQANRLRKRLTDYYGSEGASDVLRITIPIGQYVPVFSPPATGKDGPTLEEKEHTRLGFAHVVSHDSPKLRNWLLLFVTATAAVLCGLVIWQNARLRPPSTPPTPRAVSPPMVGLPVGDEIRVLAGSARGYVDRSGKLWSPDNYFQGGTSVRTPVRPIWRTQDPTLYRSNRQGEFSYDIPLKAGEYELHLYFAETYYGPENPGGGGEGSRIMNVTANGRPLLTGLDVLADSGGGRTAEVKVFTDIAPGKDGFLHLHFTSVNGASAMVSAIEILPGTKGRMRPLRIVARDAPYYSNDSHWWSADTYFKGGQLSVSEEPMENADDPELYETERWGVFSYAIPVIPGRYNVILHFVERRALPGNHRTYLAQAEAGSGTDDDRAFNIFCNGEIVVRKLNIQKEVGENRPLVQKIPGLAPNAQGKLVLEFVPVKRYATISAIEVVPQ